jgi:hypothetical protein
MAYSDFTLTKLRRQFGLEQKKISLFDSVQDIEPSQHLVVDIKEAKILPSNTEKARSENFISPILKELFRKNIKHITLFSGYGLNVDVGQGLNGNCDCIIAGRADIVELTNPIICLVEGKNGILEDGYGQCGAEMYAARIYNQELGTEISEIYGVVTIGSEWQFLMLKGQVLYFDEDKLDMARLPRILGILQYIVDKN